MASNITANICTWANCLQGQLPLVRRAVRVTSANLHVRDIRPTGPRMSKWTSNSDNSILAIARPVIRPALAALQRIYLLAALTSASSLAP